MIAIQSLSVEFGSTTLLDDISFVVNKRDRIALVGRNGAGKSTLLKIIAGLQNPTRGTVGRPADLTIGYLPQQMRPADGRSLRDEVATVFSHVKQLDDDIEALNRQLADRTDYDSEQYHELIDRLSIKTETRAMMASDRHEAEMEKTLLGLGFLRTDFDRPTAEFSGGWRMRIEIAKLLLCKPNVLLLDEPTNHLDIESIQWLETFLRTRHRGALMLVSHDRAFIDNVTNRTIEIELGHIYDYDVNYSHFVELRRERLEQQRRAYDNQQKLIHDTEQFIERFRYKATKAVQVQSRIKQLERIERIEVDEVDTSRLRLKFPPAPRSGDYPVVADGVAKSFGTHTVFSDVTFTIKRGEKVAFVGRNGEGKTTLVRCIMGQLPYEGRLVIGHNVKIGYFAQNEAQLLDGDLTVFDTVDRVAVGDIRTRLNDILGAFIFGGKASEKKVKVLSGGERSRLAMIRLLLSPANLLILDEPTNHLDMATKDVLKEAIAAFTGTAILVSHDRDFLDGLVSKVYEFGGGRVREHLGGVYDFLHSKQIDTLQELERKEASPSPTSAPAAPPSDGKQNYLDRKERERRAKQAAKRVVSLEQKAADIEGQIADIEATLAADPASAAPDIYRQHAELQQQLNSVMEQWEEACEEQQQAADALTAT